jgi:hypothetical protein
MSPIILIFNKVNETTSCKTMEKRGTFCFRTDIRTSSVMKPLRNVAEKSFRCRISENVRLVSTLIVQNLK